MSVTSNLCCDETELRRLHSPDSNNQTIGVFILSFMDIVKSNSDKYSILAFYEPNPRLVTTILNKKCQISGKIK